MIMYRVARTDKSWIFAKSRCRMKVSDVGKNLYYHQSINQSMKTHLNSAVCRERIRGA